MAEIQLAGGDSASTDRGFRRIRSWDEWTPWRTAISQMLPQETTRSARV
jgi:hypothetical protein